MIYIHCVLWNHILLKMKLDHKRTVLWWEKLLYYKNWFRLRLYKLWLEAHCFRSVLCQYLDSGRDEYIHVSYLSYLS